MILRKLVTGMALAASVTVGFAGAAGAQSPTSTAPTTTSHAGKCAKAEALLATVQKRDDAVDARLAKLEARIDQLRQNGHTKRADALSKRLDAIKARLAAVEARVAKVQARVDKACGSAPSAPSTGTTPAS